MKKSYLLLLVCFLIGGQVFCQNYAPNWGPIYKKEGGLFASYKLVGIDDDHYYVIVFSKKINTLLTYDMDHKLVSHDQLDINFGKEKIYLDKFIHTQNGTFGYMNKFDKKADQWSVFVSPFDDGKFGKTRKILSHEFKIRVKLSFFVFTNYTNNDKLNELIVSQDKSHVAYSNILSSNDNKSNEEMVVAVFDADLNEVWKKNQTFEYLDKKIILEQTTVGNDGVVYILAKVFEKREKREKGLPTYDYKVFRITKDDMKEYAFVLGDDVAPVDAALYFPNNDSEFILAGFYTDADRKSGRKGMFYASGNAEQGIKSVELSKLDADFLNDIVSEKDLKKDRGLSNGYDIDNFFKYNDGSIGFIAEEDFVVTHTSMSDGKRVTYFVYHTNSIVIPRFSSTGKLLNIQKIPKQFASRSSYITSFSSAFIDDKIYLLFNDFKDRDERTDEKGKKGRKGWRYTDMVVINKDGEIEFNETLFNSDELELEFIPDLSDYSSEKIIIGSGNGKKYSFGIIELR